MLAHTYQKVLKVMDFLIEHLATLIFILFFISLLLQVFFRFVLNMPLIWSEEGARYLNIWAVLLGAALSVKYRDHLRVDLIDSLVKKWSIRSQSAFYFMTTLIPLLLVISFLIGSFKMTISRWGVTLPTVPLPQGAIYLALLVSSILMLWFLIHHLVRHMITFIKNEG